MSGRVKRKLELQKERLCHRVCSQGGWSASVARKFILDGLVIVNGNVERNDDRLVGPTDSVVIGSAK